MRDEKGIEITQYADGYYWFKDDKYGLFLINIVDNEAYCYGTQIPMPLEKWNGQIIEEITEPII